MVSTTSQAKAVTSHTSHVALWCSISAGLVASFLAGILLATSLGAYGVGLTATGWDLARGGAILFTMIATFAGLIWWGVEQVITRLGGRVGQQQPEQITAGNKQIGIDGEVTSAARAIARRLLDSEVN